MTEFPADTPRSRQSDRKVAAAIVLITALGAALRLYHLGHYSLWYDECASLYHARFVDLRGSLFHFENTTEPPMMAVLAWMWYGLVQAVTDSPVTSVANDFAIRLMPCIFGIAAVPLAYLVTRTLLRDSRAALVAAFLVAINPFQVYYSQELRIYSFTTVLALIAIYCTHQALEVNRRRYWIGMVAAEALMMYSHYITVWFIFTMNLWFLAVAWSYRRHFWRWTAANAALMVAIVPALIMAWRMNQMVLDLWPPFYESPTWKSGLITFKSLFAWYGFIPAVYWPLFALAAALLVWGLVSAGARWKPLLLLGMLAVVPIAGNVILWSVRDFSFYEHRLFIVSGIAACIVVARGIAALRWRAATWGALVVFTALTCLALRETYAHRLHPIHSHSIAMWDKVDFRSAASFVDGHRQPGDGVLVGNHFLVYPLNHYLSEPVSRVGIHPDEAADFIEHMGNGPLLRSHGLLPSPVAEVAPKHARVWFLQTSGMTFEFQPTSDAVRSWLEANGKLAGEWDFDGVRLYLFEMPRRDPAPAH
jgi:4-amino-4-deoxy-L-arabinose transferase-like glycosyltransferase